MAYYPLNLDEDPYPEGCWYDENDNYEWDDDDRFWFDDDEDGHYDPDGNNPYSGFTDYDGDGVPDDGEWDDPDNTPGGG